MSRTIVIGDVHGCLNELDELLKKTQYSSADRLVFLGDLMDRGPDPVGCVRRVRELHAEMVLGNHCEKHIRFRKHETIRIAKGKKNPMRAFTGTKITQNAALSDDDIEWFKSLPLILEIFPGLVVVHAGLEPAFPISEQSEAVIRVRYIGADNEMVGFSEGSLEQPDDTVYWSERWVGPESVIYGHAVHSLTNPRIDNFPDGKCFGIDTGCCFGGRLTAMVIPSGWTIHDPAIFVQVEAQREYYPRKVIHGV